MIDDDRDLSKAAEAVAAIAAVPLILKIVTESTGLRFAAVARVDGATWTALAVLDQLGLGLAPGAELDAAATLCAESRLEQRALALERAALQPKMAVLCGAGVGLESHITAPITLSDGAYFGSLCAMDPEAPIERRQRSLDMMVDYAELIARSLDAELARSAAASALSAAETVGRSREEFIAVVAHDLRNPLASFNAAAELMSRGDDGRFVRIGQRLRSSATRMSSLIDDLVDFTRGRSGKGMVARLIARDDLNAALRQVVEEIRDANPARDIRTDLAIDGEVDCDAARLQQLMSNLLANAIAYGAKSSPVVVEGFCEGAEARIVVANWGQVIPAAEISQMFDPFWRAAGREAGGSLGLGLHICRQIAEAHGGALRVSSTAEQGTRFEMRWPRRRTGRVKIKAAQEDA